VKLSPPTNQYPTFYRPDVLPVTHLTVSEHWMENVCLTVMAIRLEIYEIALFLFVIIAVAHPVWAWWPGPNIGSRVERIELFHFLARCCTRWGNQAVFVLCLNPRFLFECVFMYLGYFDCVYCLLCYCVFCPLVVLLVSTFSDETSSKSRRLSPQRPGWWVYCIVCIIIGCLPCLDISPL